VIFSPCANTLLFVVVGIPVVAVIKANARIEKIPIVE
jgi:hypothetical protein